MDYEDMKAFRSQHISSRNAESMTSSMPLRITSHYTDC